MNLYFDSLESECTVKMDSINRFVFLKNSIISRQILFLQDQFFFRRYLVEYLNFKGELLI